MSPQEQRGQNCFELSMLRSELEYASDVPDEEDLIYDATLLFQGRVRCDRGQCVFGL